MGVTEGPAEGDIDGAVAGEGCAVVAAAGDAVLDGDFILPGEGDEALDEIVRDDI